MSTLLEYSESEVHGIIVQHVFRELFPTWTASKSLPTGIILLITNYSCFDKTDLLELHHKVNLVQGQQLTNALDVPFITTSVKTDHHVTKAFNLVFGEIGKSKAGARN